MRMTLSDIAEATGGCIVDADPGTVVTGVSTDTRTITGGDLFVALRGERFDGHDFVRPACEAGAAAVLVECDSQFAGSPAHGDVIPRIAAPNTLAAYGDLARAWRRRFSIPVIAITGSVGKTTTKNLTALALNPLGPVLKTEQNENNEVGLPKTLLRLNDGHRAVVLEIGMRGAGQIAALARIAEPTIGVVTVVGESHIELLGSREGIACAKAELFESLGPDGVAILNIDDPFSALLRGHIHGRTVTVGESEAADYRLLDARLTETGVSGDVATPGTAGNGQPNSMPGGECVALRLASPARHDLLNAVAAIAAAGAAGVSPRDAVDALAGYAPSPMRMQRIPLSCGAIVISDCYNAAPTSMRRALETLAAGASEGRKIAILGDMKELGGHAPAMHAEAVRYAASLGVTEIYTVGDEFRRQAPLARAQFDDSTGAADYAREHLRLSVGDVVLVKGSRAMEMERIVEALVDR